MLRMNILGLGAFLILGTADLQAQVDPEPQAGAAQEVGRGTDVRARRDSDRTRPDVRPDTRPDVRPDPRPDTRPDDRPDVRPDTRPDVRPDVRPDTRCQAGSQTRYQTGSQAGCQAPDDRSPPRCRSHARATQRAPYPGHSAVVVSAQPVSGRASRWLLPPRRLFSADRSAIDEVGPTGCDPATH